MGFLCPPREIKQWRRTLLGRTTQHCDSMEISMPERDRAPSFTTLGLSLAHKLVIGAESELAGAICIDVDRNALWMRPERSVYVGLAKY